MPTINSRLERLEQRAAPEQRKAQIVADAAWVVARLRDLTARAQRIPAEHMTEARARWAGWSRRFTADQRQIGCVIPRDNDI